MKTDDKKQCGNSMYPSRAPKLRRTGPTITVTTKTTTATSLCCLAVLVLSIYSVAQAQNNPAQTDRAGWVQIPGELIRPDCVHEIPNGATVEVHNNNNNDDDGDRITSDVTLDGAVIAHYDACPEEAIVTRPHTHSENLGHTPGAGNGWVEANRWNVPLGPNHSDNNNDDDDIDYFGGAWTVPSQPSETGALIYLFNGVESSIRNFMLQPVLQFGVGPAGGGDYWTVASWLVTSNQAFHSPLQNVYPGNSIKGYMEMTGISGSTKSWEVEAKDTTTGADSFLSAHVSGQHWTSAYAGVLEAYNVVSCTQFPSSGKEVFKGSFVDHGYPLYSSPSPQGWKGSTYPYGGPSCHFGVVASNGEFVLNL
jgi:hypothetical protein